MGRAIYGATAPTYETALDSARQAFDSCFGEGNWDLADYTGRPLLESLRSDVPELWHFEFEAQGRGADY